MKKKFIDAYGEQLWNYYKTGEPKHEIIERDDGLITVGSYGGELYLLKFKNWNDMEKKAMKFVKGRVLDIGCGGGRHALYLQEKSFDVTGIDISPLSIKVARSLGLKKAKVLPIEDIAEFKSQSFDTIIMMGNNFGLFGSFRKAQTLLKKMHRITSPDARIIAHTVDTYSTKDPIHLSYHKLNKKRGRMPGQLRLRVRYKNFVGNWFDYLIVSKKELDKILKNTGWKIESFIEGKSGQYIMVLKKV